MVKLLAGAVASMTGLRGGIHSMDGNLIDEDDMIHPSAEG